MGSWSALEMSLNMCCEVSRKSEQKKNNPQVNFKSKQAWFCRFDNIYKDVLCPTIPMTSCVKPNQAPSHIIKQGQIENSKLHLHVQKIATIAGIFKQPSASRCRGRMKGLRKKNGLGGSGRRGRLRWERGGGGGVLFSDVLVPEKCPLPREVGPFFPLLTGGENIYKTNREQITSESTGAANSKKHLYSYITSLWHERLPSRMSLFDISRTLLITTTDFSLIF